MEDKASALKLIPVNASLPLVETIRRFLADEEALNLWAVIIEHRGKINKRTKHARPRSGTCCSS